MENKFIFLSTCSTCKKIINLLEIGNKSFLQKKERAIRALQKRRHAASNALSASSFSIGVAFESQKKSKDNKNMVLKAL